MIIILNCFGFNICFSNSINNVKRFFKDDAKDYKPIGCVAATLNNSVLLKTHIACDETVKYFVCKLSEYFFIGFTNCRLCTAFDIFSNIV